MISNWWSIVCSGWLRGGGGGRFQIYREFLSAIEGSRAGYEGEGEGEGVRLFGI
jgi:hypothetical protein